MERWVTDVTKTDTPSDWSVLVKCVRMTDDVMSGYQDFICEVIRSVNCRVNAGPTDLLVFLLTHRFIDGK